MDTNHRPGRRWPKGHIRHRRVLLSLPADLADEIDRDAAESGKTRSAWVAEAAERKLRQESDPPAG